jgi:hypothetical protein
MHERGSVGGRPAGELVVTAGRKRLIESIQVVEHSSMHQEVRSDSPGKPDVPLLVQEHVDREE